jgi:uncharacterized metal-binding protein YceD (DUF177 family)
MKTERPKAGHKTADEATAPGKPWSSPIRVEDVLEAGRHVALEADDAVRAAVAKAARVDGVDRLTAAFDLTRRGRDGLRVVGAVDATVRQTCVVSLEPVTNQIHEEIDLVFAPPRDVPAGLEGDEIDVARALDEPEDLIGGTVDLGVIATEFVILAVDPYPRKAGVAFEAPRAPEDAAAHPFASLAALQRKGTVKD